MHTLADGGADPPSGDAAADPVLGDVPGPTPRVADRHRLEPVLEPLLVEQAEEPRLAAALRRTVGATDPSTTAVTV
jgi:hypothetical protein